MLRGKVNSDAKPGRKSVQPAMLAPVEKPNFADQQIYHKDPTSQNALIIWIPIRLSVAADFSIGSSISQSKRFDVELGKMDVELETRSSSERGHPVRQRAQPAQLRGRIALRSLRAARGRTGCPRSSPDHLHGFEGDAHGNS